MSGTAAVESVAQAARRVLIGGVPLHVDTDVIAAGAAAPLAVVEAGLPRTLTRTQSGSAALRWDVLVKVAGQSYPQAERICAAIGAEAVVGCPDVDGWRVRDVEVDTIERVDYTGGPPQAILVLQVSPVLA